MLIEKINAWAELCPERIAHRHREQMLTYARLKTSSDSLATWLYDAGERGEIRRGTPIVVYGHKESEMLTCFIGCVKAGFPYIPVDSATPPERVRQIIEVSGAWLVLSPQRVPQEMVQAEMMIVDGLVVDREGNLRSAEGDILSELPFPITERHVQGRKSGTVPTCIQPKNASQEPSLLASVPTCIQEDEVYYIIYTSGSTGVPKGVQITLRALESFLGWVNPAFQPEAGNEVFLNQAPFSFDLSVMDLYMSLSMGGTLWSVDKDQIANPKELFTSFHSSGISYWVSTPSFAEVCLMDPSFTDTLLPLVKRFLFCGEILTHDCASKLIQRFPRARVENLYGPTEATVAVTTLTITSEILSAFNPLPVGGVKPDALVLICDTDELSAGIVAGGGSLPNRPEALPEGKQGEMIIAGPNVSVGYLNNPEQTEKAFFSWQESGVTWLAYRTGDAGMVKQGLLFYQGRLDFQVKLHGYRIELGEIEENLRQIPMIENAVVLPIERRGKIDYLQAFITGDKPIGDEFATVLALREELRQHLPEYMIPRRFKFLDKMPMTQNGKVDRRALLGGSS
ncbi:D-alanine--poly(phosphoribitol) ligase subunit 1 [Candidatus Desulfosporosinus infrequens]|uniref:D-alanine--poly(Phosphoribitol) ligase subunit 1 n=1 Tax=Candidatus Desulfosporosinus infrequens TaxID=2043169 RepID=A0A2U3K2J6_9FIRM|nr:D-alanine--poly(phosphoribitol) ligase subunit 1 [Candidatus Desulfosporosinus infrequens]